MDDPRSAAYRPRLAARLRLALVGVILAAVVPAAAASRVEPLNLVDLIVHSDHILRGTVTRVTDGDNGDVSYTEVTLRVAESILGGGGDEYTFRQVGRGLPTWTPGERVVLFLEGPTGGLQTTVGPHQGKLRHFDGKLSSSLDNEGLFAGVGIDASGLSLDQVAMLEGGTDVVDADAFLDLVRRAVREDWINRGVMRRDGEEPPARPLRRTASQSKETGEPRDGSP